MSRFLAMAFALMLMCAGFGTGAHAEEDSTEAQWLKLIEAEVGTACEVKKLRVTHTAVGNNGVRFETWVMQTCLGQVEYGTAYHPPAAFPNRPSPYEVKRLTPKGKPEPASSPR